MKIKYVSDEKSFKDNTVFTFLLIWVIQAIHSNIWSMKLKCVTSKQSVVTSYLEWKLVTLEMAIAYLS